MTLIHGVGTGGSARGVADGVPCMWMRGGTSKGAYFLANDLPPDRDAFLLGVMGSPDPRQIDGMGGGDPLTSKVAVVRKSDRPGIDVDYLFLQVAVDQPLVSDSQNCGNILAGVAPFAIERKLVEPVAGSTQKVSIFMENSNQVAVATVQLDGGHPTYRGDSALDGVPGTAAGIPLEFRDIAGSTCGALLPTGNTVDTIDGVPVTMIDNGMPVVVLDAAEMGIGGQESREDLDARAELKGRLERLRLVCGPLMNLGNVAEKTVPKMTMVSPPAGGGTISTRTFIPHRCHASIGVFGAISVATACLLPGSPAEGLAAAPGEQAGTISIEHPSGATTVIAETGADGAVTSTAILRTARKLFDGTVFA